MVASEFLSTALAHTSAPVLWATREIKFPQGSYAAEASPVKQFVWQAEKDVLLEVPNSYRRTTWFKSHLVTGFKQVGRISSFPLYTKLRILLQPRWKNSKNADSCSYHFIGKNQSSK